MFLTSIYAGIFSAFASEPVVYSEIEQLWLYKNPAINLGFDGNFPPYSFLNSDGQLEGFSIDVFNYIEQNSPLTFTVSTTTQWSELYQLAKTAKIDVVATMVNRDERHQWFNFTPAYISKSLVVLTRGDDNRIEIRNDLRNKTLALVRGYQYADKVLEQYPSITPLYVDNILDSLTAVSTGKADATITFLGAGHFYRTKYILSDLKYALVYDKNSSPESIAVNKSKPELAAILSKAIKSIPEAKLQAMREKWLPVEYIDSITEIHLTKEEINWIQQHPNIRLGVDPEFAPFEFIENGQYQGITSDYIQLLNTRLNMNMTVVPNLKWKEVIEQAKTGNIDVLPAVGKNTAREQFLSYTQPYLNFHRVILTRENMPFIADLSDIQNMKVAVQKNSSHHGFLRDNSIITPITYPTLQASLMALSGGEVDAFIGNVASTTYWVRKLNLSNVKIAAPVSSEAQSLHFAVNKQWPELVSILQKGLDSISAAQKKRISEKWLSFEYQPPVNMKAILYGVISLCCIIAIILSWNILLKRKVRQRTAEVLRFAHYDQLTNLPNRFLIQDRLQQQIKEAKQKNTCVAVLSINIDDFKRINASLSYEVGDQLLQKISLRLSSLMKEHGDIGRLGSDQYLAVVNHIKEASDIALLAQDVLRVLNASVYNINQHEITVSACIGIAFFPNDGVNAEQLLKHADNATHHAKKIAQGSYAFFTEELNKNSARRLVLESEMREAMLRNEFSVVYQPKVNAITKEIIGFEALLRWHNRELGEVSPVEFIDIAEKNNFIHSLGSFVLETALLQLATWQQLFKQSLTMAVNLSPVQFQSTNLFSHIKQLLEESQVTANTLELEITEGVLLNASEHVENTLNAIEEHGIKLAMDDFGTGYSSMSNLRRFNFNTLKIDREFVRDVTHNVGDQNLIKATINMAQGLNMQVVAEGIETQEQASYLTKNHCDILQGYLFSRPISAIKMTNLLNEQLVSIPDHS
jgi:diguanylate cyclase (GGDEF)-like protein